MLEKAKDQRTQESYDFSTLVPVMAPLALFCGPVLCCTVSAVSERQGCSPHRAASLGVRLASSEMWDWTVIVL